MPANKKYLTKSGSQKIATVTAAILGSYFVTVSLHLALASLLDRSLVMVTMAFSGFILWAGLMMLAFLTKNGWKIWGVYLALSVLFSLISFI